MERKVEKIVADIEKRKLVGIEKNIFQVDRILFRIYKRRNIYECETDTKFWVTNQCIMCGKCEKNCPVGNINIKDGNITWNRKCLTCFRCLHGCPMSAIEFGSTTVGRERYQNPWLNNYKFER